MTIQTNDHQTSSAATALAFYGKMLTFSRVQFSTDDLSIIEAELAKTLSNKSSNIPVLIDSDVEQDLSALVELLWSWGLQPIGVVTGILDEQARAQRLAIFPADGKRIERIVSNKKPPARVSETPDIQSGETNTTSHDTAATNDAASETTISTVTAETLVSAEHITSLFYDQMLRSGQSLNHVGGDLILTNSVNSGAEAITDNSLHVYGRAQGRLVAGATGDKDARIFCQVFNPTLVSVAGTYCLRDNLPEHVIDKSVQVRFVEGEGLVFTVMDNA
ncbi:septum site-determining protein MinC [Psychrobacter alimentarius]|uniref:Probable septum site-determining protein MinC n=1 Tax=Psychrobacter alimentarius TaxID=261164 RepID=A0ABN4N563_9GAMM|nr:MULTISPECIES: septum site-determining protein MinC [Psychrobacter]AMT97907.1 septum site-determining protein MinC [Psychrobacter alimentarius]PAT62817.1 septum site-determining protein MinC [Psychrobacter sp. JB193]QCB29816.1 septum site-determining protein MinC [Psychrobacter sp. PAMC27889]